MCGLTATGPQACLHLNNINFRKGVDLQKYSRKCITYAKTCWVTQNTTHYMTNILALTIFTNNKVLIIFPKTGSQKKLKTHI